MFRPVIVNFDKLIWTGSVKKPGKISQIVLRVDRKKKRIYRDRSIFLNFSQFVCLLHSKIIVPDIDTCPGEEKHYYVRVETL